MGKRNSVGEQRNGFKKSYGTAYDDEDEVNGRVHETIHGKVNGTINGTANGTSNGTVNEHGKQNVKAKLEYLSGLGISFELDKELQVRCFCSQVYF